jgi:large conductance mechanosensitive channel
MSILSEFKTFVSRGNAVELAIGVVIGAAFQKVVDSIVNDIIMPPIGYLIGKVDFKDLKLKLGEVVTINYGSFIQTLIQFVIIAFTIFLVVKLLNRMKMKSLNYRKYEKNSTHFCVLLFMLRISNSAKY